MRNHVLTAGAVLSRQILLALSVAMLLCSSVAGADTVAKETPAEAKKAKAEKVTLFGESYLMVPADFKRTKPANRIIAHEFAASAGEGDDKETARVTFMPAGGGVKANIDRWMGQFSGGDADKQKSETHEVGDWKVHVVDCSGRYGERMGGGPFAPGRTVQREGYAMTGAIIEHPEGRLYFVKMIGPAKVIDANRKAFVEMVKEVK